VLFLPAAKLFFVPFLWIPESLRLKRWFSCLGEQTGFAMGSCEQAAVVRFLTVVNLFLSIPLFYKRACKISYARC
jgi:hypothetical protein